MNYRSHLFLLIAALAAVAMPRSSKAASVSPDEAKAIAIDAYIYGYSLITTEVTRVQMTNVDKIEGLRGPMVYRGDNLGSCLAILSN